MKKTVCIALAIIVCVAVTAIKLNQDEGIYRLHIIANSDSDADQSVKLKVRDAILEYESELFANRDVKNAKQAKQLLMDNAGGLYAAAVNTLNEQNFDYGVKLSTGTYLFPDREYSGVLYPAGEYDALRVVLGEGKGENWWCVMFPPLCIMHNNTAENADNQAVEFTSIFGEVGKWFASLFNVTS